MVRLDAILIGNAAAALHGAPVTTLDFDFFFRKTPGNLRKLKSFARGLGATVLRPYYPVSDFFRVVRDQDGLQVDFMSRIHGVRSFEGLRSRAETVEIDGIPLRVAALSDIIRSKRAAGRPRDRAMLEILRRRRLKKPRKRRERLDALARENRRAIRDMIRRRLALPPERRTHFLRSRTRFRGSSL
jgi:predicted nucleotidyltransferase